MLSRKLAQMPPDTKFWNNYQNGGDKKNNNLRRCPGVSDDVSIQVRLSSRVDLLLFYFVITCETCLITASLSRRTICQGKIEIQRAFDKKNSDAS